MVRASDAYIKSGDYAREMVTKRVPVTPARTYGRWRQAYEYWSTGRCTPRRRGSTSSRPSPARIGERLTAAHGRRPSNRWSRRRRRPERSGVALVLRNREVELVDHYKANSTARGSWGGNRATCRLLRAVPAGPAIGRAGWPGSVPRGRSGAPASAAMTGRWPRCAGRSSALAGRTPEPDEIAAARAQPSSPRDFQRSRVYDAEHLVHRIFDRSAEYPVVEVAGSRITLPVERRFGSIDAVQRYVDGVLALPWVAATWDRARHRCGSGNGAGEAQAHYQRVGSIMAVPGYRAGSGWALRELVILHELAHHLATASRSPRRSLCRPTADVGRRIVGPEAALLLRVTMLDVGVEIG